ncbi:MAG: polynucleotide adenylyltransferase PcnB [Pseudohongiellaceae bacterium]
MLKKLRRVFSGKPEAGSAGVPAPVSNQPPMNDRLMDSSSSTRLRLDQARIVERDKHCISRKNISNAALKVLYTLGNEGYHAFLVGGGVRDLLLGNKPKDFDIATDATPEEIKRLFRSSRIIGRRFKIVHIRFGREIIEATTFRAHHGPVDEGDEPEAGDFRKLDSAHSSSGMILRDNVYGNIDEDALRRDFTVNALYYTVNNFRLLDFSTGFEDLENRLIRVLGDPAVRYKEDPVRMLRAIRFCAKLDFSMEENSRSCIDQFAHLLQSVSPARLFDESLKLLAAGFAQPTFVLLKQYRVGEYLFPDTMKLLSRGETPENKLVQLALRNTDERLAQDKSVTPAFLYAALLWPVLRDELQWHGPDSLPNLPEIQTAANTVIQRQIEHVAIPRRFTIAMREIWELQLRLQRRNKRSIESAFNHPRFRAAYDFLLLREESGEDLDQLGRWWTDFQNGDTKHKTELTEAFARSRPKRRRRSRKKSGTGE